jgi:hypothetical protein
MSGYRASSEPRSKQAGRERVQDGRLPRKSRVRGSLSRSGDLYLDLPDEHDPVTIPRSER